MKQIGINTLLEPRQEGVMLQKEWSSRSGQGVRSWLLESALFAGLAGPGLYIVSYFINYLVGILLSFLIVLIGYGLPHMFFLGRWERSWMAIIRPHSSWISRGFIIALFFLLSSFLVSVLSLLPLDEKQPAGAAVFTLAEMLGLLSAVLLAIYPGFLFAVVKAIPLWNTALIIPLFLVQAVGCGLAFLFLLALIPGSGVMVRQGHLAADVVLILASGLLIGAYVHGRLRSDVTSKLSLGMMLRGNYRYLFLGGAVGAGLGLPLLILVYGLLADSTTLLWLAALAQLAGVFLFKYCMLNAGAYPRVWKG